MKNVRTVDVRCKHNEVFAVGEKPACAECELEEYMLGEEVPFTVRCLEDKGAPVKKDALYTVAGVMRDGYIKDYRGPGILLFAEGKVDIFPRIFETWRFIFEHQGAHIE